MTKVNLQARRLRLLIGTDEQDWSEGVGVFNATRTPISDSGLLLVTGDLELLPVIGAPESLDPQENPERWARGNPVRVQVRNDANSAWVDHPLGRLNLLEEPEFPEPGQGITLALGCILQKHNGFEFDDDATGVVVGTPENSATVAQRLLEANEIPTGNISLGTWPYPLGIPKGKEENSNFIGQAGGLAYSNDWRYLYQNTAGNVVDSALTLAYAAPVITITLGTNDVLYQGIKVDRTPPNRVKVAGMGTTTEEQSQPIVEIAEVTGDRSQFSVGNITCAGSGVVSRSTSATTWFTVNSGATMILRTVTTLEAPRSAVARDPNRTGGFPCSLTAWKTITEEKRFDLTKNGRLIRKNTTERQRRFTFMTGINADLQYATVREIEETPAYADDEVLSSITTVEEQALGILDPNANGAPATATSPLRMVETRNLTTKWRQRGNQNWTKIEEERLPKALTDSSPETDPTAIVGRATTTTSNTGQTQPPRAEFWDGAVIDSDTEFQGEAFYTPPGGLFGRTEKALYQVPFGFSPAQCEGLAQKWVQLIAGRHRAALLEFPVSDALLAAPPLSPCDVVMPDGEVRHYRVDGLSWSHSQTQASAAGTGILVAVTPAPTLEVPEPTPIPLTAVPVFVGEDQVFAGANPIYAMV
jgi:hypothetical protein